MFELTKDIIQNGLAETIQDRKEDIAELLSDPSIQAFLFLTVFTAVTLAGLGVVALAAGGLLVSWQAANLLNQIDSLLQSASTRTDAMEAITDPKLRRQIVTTIILLGLVIFGGAKTLKEFNTFQGTLSPSAQQTFADLNILQQIKLFETAGKLNVSPEALEFYLAESVRPGSPLSNLSLTNALKVSTLAEQSGKGTFILDYLWEYGFDNTLKSVSPEILSQYVDLAKVPDSLLQKITPQNGIEVLSGKVIQSDPVFAVELAAELATVTGKNAWASPFTGKVYLSSSSALAVAAKNQLIAEGVNSPNVNSLLQIIAQQSVRGTGDRFQLGPYLVRDPLTGLVKEVAGVEKGVYIQDSLNNGTKFFDVGEVYNELKAAGFTDDQLWSINQEAIRINMESGSPIDFVYTDIDAILLNNAGKLDTEIPFRVRELRWIIEHAEAYGYVREGNSWIWQPVP